MSNDKKITEDKGAIEARKKIAKMYTKDELVQRALDAFDQIAEILQLVNIAMPNLDDLSPIKREMIKTASSKQMQENAKIRLWYLISSYNRSIKSSISNIEDNKHE